MDDTTRTALEAAAFRRLLHHLMQDRPDVQNIDLMTMAGFCHNCLSRWYQEAAADQGIELDTKRQQQLISLFKLRFANPDDMRADVRGKVVYLGLAMNDQGLLKLKPQNLLLNLPLVQEV